MERRRSKEVGIGNVVIGNGHPIAVQSMTNTKTKDVQATILQIQELTKAGCDIIRVAVPDEESALAIREIKKEITIPLVADIHFDYRLAIKAVEAGADKIRINPGNIGSKDRIREVARSCEAAGVPIRVGVNSGSIEKEIYEAYGRSPRALVESALKSAEALESVGFSNMVVAIKGSDVPLCVESYELFAKQTDYPLHLGVTEAGTTLKGSVKSALGIGILLHEGIGDTIRVSLTSDPLEEVIVGHQILQDLGLEKGVEIVSCPTCGRTQIDLIGLAKEAEKALAFLHKPVKIAIMGCVVNGPGEARDADFGIAGGKGEGLVFRKGEIIRKVPETELLAALVEEAKRYED